MTHHDPDQSDALPDALAQRLRDSEDALPFVPDEVDQAVLGRARAHFAGRSEAQPTRRGWSPWLKIGLPLAAAAAIALGFFAVQTSMLLRDVRDGIAATPQALAPGGHAELAWDVDRSGRLDILDVYLLAKRQETGDDAVSDELLADLTARVVSLDRATARHETLDAYSPLATPARPTPTRPTPPPLDYAWLPAPAQHATTEGGPS